MLGATISEGDVACAYDVVQLFSQSTEDGSNLWQPNEFAQLRNNGVKKIYSHAMFKVVLGKHYAKKIITGHYKYLCENKIDGYIVHIPANIEITECVKFIGATLAGLTDCNCCTTIYFEHIPSEFYSKAHVMKLFAERLAKINTKVPLGICIDTCHIYSSGIDIGDYNIVVRYLRELAVPELRAAGIKLLLHLNDSVNDLGSFVDRHAPIGNKIWASSTASLKYLLANIADADVVIELRDHTSSLALVKNILADAA
jgi:endonuclease IV